MTLTRFALLFSTFLMACDADKDGLTNSEEEERGQIQNPLILMVMALMMPWE